MRTKVISFNIIICLITAVFFCLFACDNGSAPDSDADKTSGLVNVCFTVEGDSSVLQKSASIGGSAFTYQYKAVPQWSQDQAIHGRTSDWTVINYSAGMSLGYFAPGQWIFYIRILNEGTPVYEGHSAVIGIGSANANVTVTVSKIIQEATPGVVSITITAPVINALTDSLTVAWSGTASGSDTAAATTSGGTTTFTFIKDDLADGSYTFTITHTNVANTAAETVVVSQGTMVAITGHLDNGEWQTENTTLQFHTVSIVKYNWGTEQEPEYCGSVDIDVSSAVKGERISFSTKPITNSGVDSLTVTCGGSPVDYNTSNNLHTFIMPDGDVTINVTFIRVVAEEVDVLLFKTIVQALYTENIATVQSFGQAAGSPGVGDNPASLGDVKVWYDSTNNKICWHSDADRLKLGAGSLAELFSGCDRFTSINLNKIITSDITNMSGMFEGCTNLATLDITTLNVGSATDLSNMFKDCSSLTSLTLPASFDTSAATDISGLFQGCTGLTSLSLTGFTTNTTSGVNMARLFKDCSGLTSITLPAGFDTSMATSLAGLFQGCTGISSLNLTSFDASSATDISNMFQGCTGLTSITLTGFTTNTTSGVNMAGLFQGCSKLTSITLPASFNTSRATNMAGMFYGCEKLNGTLNLSNFNTANVTDMSYMFCACRALTGINFGSNFSTANVTDMSYMFSSQDSVVEPPPAMNLTSLDVTGFDTAKVTNMKQMFYLCYKLTTLDVSGFNTAKVTDMSSMFACYNYNSAKYPGKLTTLNLSGWDFTNVTTVAHIFDRQEKLDSGLTFPSETNFKSLTTMTYMFSQCLALTPSTFRTVVSTWKFSAHDDYLNTIYGNTNPTKSMFGNAENNNNGQNSGANYIFRENNMTASGKKFETRDSYTTADGIALYIGGGNSQKFARLTTVETP